MTRKLGIPFILIVLSLLAIGIPVFAHHGTAGVYDFTVRITTKAVVKEYIWANPHVQIYVETKDEQGTVEKWNGEASNALALHRAGWNSKIIKPGDPITMTGYQAKTGAKMLRLKSVTLSDGRELETFPRE